MSRKSSNYAPQALDRIAVALEKLAFGTVRSPGEAPPPSSPSSTLSPAVSPMRAYVWQAQLETLKPLATVNRLPLDLLLGVERPKALLLENTRRFAAQLPANNALLWGARGMGKSSLVKAVHGQLAVETGLELIEISRTDISSLAALNTTLAERPAQCLIYCDDLSFDYDDGAYKSLKTVLDGGLTARPGNVLFYATSNRRHLMPRDMMEYESGSAITPGEAVDEKLSLSDRFGLWLGFHKCDQQTYLAMIEAYAAHFGLDLPRDQWRTAALEWQVTRGARSGRVAWQFFQDLAGQQGKFLGQ